MRYRILTNMDNKTCFKLFTLILSIGKCLGNNLSDCDDVGSLTIFLTIVVRLGLGHRAFSHVSSHNNNCILKRGNKVRDQMNEQTWINEPSKPWISEIFAEAEEQFSIHAEASEKCKNDFELYKLHLKNSSLWAVRMFESSQWPKQGLYVGTTPSLGYFDNCITVNAFDIRGKHCLVESTFHFHEFSSVKPTRSLDTPSQNNSAWLALQMLRNDVNRIERNKLRWSLCIPSSCSSVDLNKSLRHAVHTAFAKYSISTTTNLMEGRCHTNQTKLSWQYYSVKYFISSLVFIIIFASIIQEKAIKNLTDHGMCSNIVECFSIQKNYDKLTRVESEREYMLMHVSKMLVIVAFIMMHRLAFMIRHVHHDNNAIELMIDASNYAYFHGPEFTDIMFFFSGFLMYTDFVRLNTNNITEILIKIAKRWLRLFPTYVIVRLFYAHILPFLNNGALWHEMRDEATYCKTNMLDALLTLPTARNEKLVQCLPSSWQMAVDFQLFTIGYISLSLCRHYKINAIKVLSCLVAISSIMTFCNIFYNQYTAILFMNLRLFNIERSKKNTEVFHSTYLSVATRLAPYIIGSLIAAASNKMKENQRVLSKEQQTCVLTIAVCIQSIMTTSGLGLYNLRTTNEYRRMWHSLHGALHHSLTNSLIICLFFIYFVNGFDYLEKRIPRVVVPLSRLSHTVGLSHFIVILPHIFSQRTLISYTNLYSLAHILVADIVLSFTLGFLLYLFIDGPIQNLLKNRTKRTRS